MRIINAATVNNLGVSRNDQSSSGGDLGKDDFLTLLMTQMGQQDPLAPMDNTQFVSQLTQFANLERLENMAASLENLALSQVANTSAQMTSFIGQTVRVDSTELHVTEGVEDFAISYTLGEEATECEVIIRNEDGRVVRTMDLGASDQGSQAISWDGTNDDGGPVPEGKYTFEVHAKDEEGEPVSVSTQVTRLVTGVSFEDGFPMLMLADGGKARLGDVREVTQSGATSDSD